MTRFLAALIFCVVAVPAHAGWMIPNEGNGASPHHIARAHRTTGEGWRDRRVVVRNHETGFVVSVLSASCRIARALGGPCGCFASEYFFGRSVRELWLANAWLAFPRVAPAAGTAAVWPNRHVAAVIAAHRD